MMLNNKLPGPRSTDEQKHSIKPLQEQRIEIAMRLAGARVKSSSMRIAFDNRDILVQLARRKKRTYKRLSETPAPA